MQTIEIRSHYDRTKKYAENETGRVGMGADGFAPYELLFSALSGCFYANFSSILKKMKIDVESVDIKISGYKEAEGQVKFLKKAQIDVYVKGYKEDQKKGIIRSADLASEYCSIHKTLEKVADLEHTVHFYE